MPEPTAAPVHTAAPASAAAEAAAPPAPPAPVKIPIPEFFPVAWPTAEAETYTWQQDRMHAPQPMTPMSAYWATRFEDGITGALAFYDLPVRLATHCFNTYFYLGMHLIVPPEELPAAGERAEAALRPAIPMFQERWDKEWLPELQETWRQWEAFDQTSASLQELTARFEKMEDIYRRCWRIHFELLIPAFAAWALFTDMYKELLGGGELEPLRLLRGFDNMSLQAGRKLWALSRTVRADPALRAVVETVPSDELHGALEASTAGRAFRKQVDEYLAEFGHRSDTVQELRDPMWYERPAPMFDALKAYLRQDEDPDTTHARLAAEREEALAKVRQRLEAFPPEVRGQFEFLMKAAQQCSSVQEDHNYWIDQRSLSEVRALCLEIGKRLADARTIARAEDILYLTGDELYEVVEGRLHNPAALIASRRDEEARWAKVTPPPVIGTDYGPPPPNPVIRALERFFGGPVEVPTPTEIRGNAGSSGRIRGTARIVMTIAEAGRLQPGEILVTPTTAPPWTPLFSIAGGIVTDTGGALSHCAIVAREYGLPAVVGTGSATSLIQDGQLIEVDGDAGLVRIL